MQFIKSLYSLPVFLELATTAHGSPHHAPNRRSETSSFNASSATLDEFASYALDTAKSRIGTSSTCTEENLTVRKPWEDLGSAERIAYTGALKCLMEKPAKTPSDVAPGAKSRYDDWIVAHINQTLTIHQTANFLGWHRWFIWEMEQGLRTECNYTGAIPYWDWTKTAKEGFDKSEIFDGSATSMSGNGLPVKYNATDKIIIELSETVSVDIPVGTGGGCVTTGPFANLTVHLGPDSLTMLNGDTDDSGWKFKYNPRCLKRDLTDYALQRYANESSVLTLLRDMEDIRSFETILQGAYNATEIGVHGGGHYSLGGDPGRDVYVSPGEPIFWLHHANIDRVWWMWQMLDPAVRGENVSTAVSGPLTFWDLYEPHGNGSISSLQNLGYVSEGTEVALGDLMSTTEGMFCYVYE